MAKQPKEEIRTTGVQMDELVEDFGDPEALMPTPDRLKESEEPVKPREALEAPVRSPAPAGVALPVKPVSGIVEPDSLAVIRARKDARLANLRR